MLPHQNQQHRDNESQLMRTLVEGTEKEKITVNKTPQLTKIDRYKN